MKSNTLSVILDCLGIPYTNSYADALYEGHPHDSMFAISRLLDVYGIPSRGLMLGDKQEIAKIEPPFVAQYRQDLVVVKGFSGQRVTFYQLKEENVVPIDEFCERCSGAVLIFETNQDSGEPGFTKNRREDLFRKHAGRILPICLLFLALIPVLKGGFALKAGEIIELLLYIAGVFLCYALVMKELDFDNSLAVKLCSVIGSKGSCEDVIQSKGSKLAGIIGLAEMGLGFFFASVIIVSFCRDLLPWIRLINICTLFFIPWSIWYQKKKVNKWCPLCLSVLSVFLFLFFNSLFFKQISFPAVNVVDLIEVSMLYLVSILSAYFIVSALAERSKLQKMTTTLVNVKFGETAFEAILKSQQHYDVNTASSSIIFGNPDSANLITIVSNPHCGPCGKIHDKIMQLIQKRGDSLCVQFFFLNFKKEGMTDSGKFLISAYLQGGKENALPIYGRWFGGERENVPQFFGKFDFDIDSEDVLYEQKRHEEWCAEQDISGTPTILVNGYRLPPEYDLTDLLFIF